MRRTHAPIPAIVAQLALADENLRVTGLEILSSRRLDVDHGGIVARAGTVGVLVVVVGLGDEGLAHSVLRRIGLGGGRHDEVKTLVVMEDSKSSEWSLKLKEFNRWK